MNIKILLESVKIIIIFTLCTIIFYYGMIWIQEDYEPQFQKFRVPNGESLKVNSLVNSTGKEELPISRWQIFFEYGE